MESEAPLEATSPTTEQMEFRILLRGVKLDPSLEKALCQEIRNAILQEISQLGHDGEIHITSFEAQPQVRPLLGESSRLMGMVVTNAVEG